MLRYHFLVTGFWTANSLHIENIKHRKCLWFALLFYWLISLAFLWLGSFFSLCSSGVYLIFYDFSFFLADFRLFRLISHISFIFRTLYASCCFWSSLCLRFLLVFALFTVFANFFPISSNFDFSRYHSACIFKEMSSHIPFQWAPFLQKIDFLKKNLLRQKNHFYERKSFLRQNKKQFLRKKKSFSQITL